MKRVFLVMLSVVFFVSSTFAQLPRAQMERRLAGKVEKAAQEASVKNLQEARSTLAIAYLSGMFGVVDEVLTQYPELVNETIKGEYGETVPMVYHAFARDKKLISNIKNIKANLEADKGVYEYKKRRYYEALGDKDNYDFTDPMPFCFQDSWSGTGDDAAFEFILCALGLFLPWDIIALVVDVLGGAGYSVYNGIRIVNRKKKFGDEEEKVQLREKKLKSLEAVLSSPNIMLLTFYKHEAQCPRCYAESLKDGDLTVSEALTLSYYLPTYGATAKEILKLGKNKGKALILAKEIRVTESTLPELVAATSNSRMVEIILERAVSNEPAVQKQIREYRTAYKEILSRLKRANAQQDDYLKDVKAIISSFDGHLDIALMFMKKFPNADIKEVKYVKYSFIIPVVRVKDKVYDARPETFGKLFPTS